MKSLIVILLFGICHVTANAQSYFRECGIQLLTQQEGLSNNTVNEIHQDKDGFLWLGTDIGLSRYDGIHFHNYNLIDAEPYSIASIYETSNNLLWSQTANRNEIVCFDKLQGCYIPLSSSMPEVLNEVQDMCVLQNKLFVITSKGIAEVNIEQNAKGVNLNAKPLPDIKGNPLKIYGHKNTLYILMQDNRILLYNISTGKNESINCADADIKNIDNIDNIHIYNDCLWISCHNAGIICYDINKKVARKLTDKNQQDRWLSSQVHDIIQIDDTSFIIATRTSLFKITFAGKNYIQEPFQVVDLIERDSYYTPILKNRITQTYFDKTNAVLWVGTFGRGVLKLNIKGQNVNRIQPGNNIKTINGIAQDANGYFWLATKESGIYKSAENEISPNLHFTPWEKSDKNSGYCLHKGKNGHIWFGDNKGNILQVNPTTKETVSFHPHPEGTQAATSAIVQLFLNSRNHLWVATEQGLTVYDHQTNECMAFMPYTKETGKVTAICEDGDGTMWLGTEKGLNRAQKEGKQIKLAGGYEKKAGLTPGKVLALYLNNYNQLFVSYADKIIQIDGKEKNVSSTMLLQKNLPSGHVKCMIDDKNGNTWLGTNSGIITISNKNNAFYVYAFPESYYDVCRLNNGILLWANSTGLLYFDPRIMKETSNNRQFHISDIDVNYKKVEIGEKINGQVILDKPVNLADRLTLKYNNNNLILYLSDLKYGTSPNRVEYRLLPRDKEWQTGYNDQITLSNIEAGEYVLEIKPPYLMEGNEQITRLPINITKYWATSGPAVTGYIIIIALIVLLTAKYINHRTFKRKVNIAKEVKLKERLEEATEIWKEEEKSHQMRDQIRYTLAQELRTPLSLVTAPLKEMIDNPIFPESLLQKAKVAYRNSISLQDICNQLLNIHQQENYGSKLNVAPYSASSIADEVVRSSYELLNVSPINLHYDKDNKINTEIWIDRKKINFVLRNILSNAYRHISYSGTIRFSVNISTINGKNFCLFTIEDDGKEMVEESSVTYLGADNSGSPSNRLHPELGIEIMKETVVAHQGDIKIQQEKKTGTQVTLYLPLGKQHFEGKEYVSFIEPEEIPTEETSLKILTVEDKKIQEAEESIIASPINSPKTKYKLLVIEDHSDIRLYLKVLFSSTYNIIMAENGEEGVRMARKEIPDIIITDVMMPVMTGFECCRILKEDLKTCHIPIILLTALVGDEDVVKGIELGADDYILKPFNPEILRSKVKRLIKSRLELKQIYTKLLMPSIAGNDSQVENEVPSDIEDPFITQILNIVNENLQNPDFNVKKLAEMLNMSQPTLYRKVKQLTNFTIIELIRGVRLKRSAELLRTRQYSVQEVAETVGYNDIPTFRKHFVDFYGTTPSTFNNKEEAEDKK